MKLENGIRVFIAGTWGSNEKYLTTYRNDKTYGFITSNSLEQLRGGIIDEIKSVGLSPNETVYFSPLCKVPRYKIDEYTQSNNLNLTKCYMFRTAQKVILNRKHLTKLLNVQTKEYFKIPVKDLYEKGPGMYDHRYNAGGRTEYVKIPRDEFKYDYVLLEIKSSYCIIDGLDCSQYPVIKAFTCDTQLESKEYKFIAELFEAIKQYKFVIGEDDSVLQQTNKELIIDEDVYQSLRSMLSSSDYNNHNVAKELIANSNFKESEVYLLMLIHEFQRSLIGGAKTPNYQVFLNKYSDWKLFAKRTDWFNYGLKLINKYPNDRDKIKGFMIARFNRAAGTEVLTDMVFKTK